MKRLHVHVAVEDLSTSIGFYATLFGDRQGKRTTGRMRGPRRFRDQKR